MNRWILIRRVRGPVYLLLFGVTALLNQWDILSFSQSWPLYLVVAGVLMLVERAAFERQTPLQPPYPGQMPVAYPPSGWQTPPPPPGTNLVPVPPSDLERSQGGQ